MKVIRLNKIQIQYIENYQTGYNIKVENWVSPYILLKKTKARGYKIQFAPCLFLCLVCMGDTEPPLHSNLGPTSLNGPNYRYKL